ncbi:MAG: winged helix-turn-helix domain-containing protein [Bdellovibrio sp.]|nr:winged helix-turn-helix domain-containing protein [Bdellovibrio sp.]
MQSTPSNTDSNSTGDFTQFLQIPSTELMDIVEAAIWVVSLDGTIEYVNPSICKMFGYTREEMLRRHAVDFIGHANSGFVTENIAKRKKGMSEIYSFSLPRRDGTTLDVMIAANAVFDRNKNVIGAMAVITENKGSAVNANKTKTITDSEEYSFGNLKLYPASIEYAMNGERFEISHFAFRLLSYFVKNHSRVITRSEIIEHVWEESQTSDRVIDAHIVALRKKLKNFDGALKMVYGLGYILKLTDKTTSNA